MKLIYLLAACTLGVTSSAFSQGDSDPTVANLDVTVDWLDYDQYGEYNLEVLASEHGEFKLEYSSVTHTPWGPPAYYTMTGTEVVHLSILEGRLELTAIVETAYWTFGQPQYGTEQIEIIVERGLHPHSYQRFSDILTFPTGYGPRPINGYYRNPPFSPPFYFESVGTFEIVPEPASFVAVGLGLGLALLLKRRK